MRLENARTRAAWHIILRVFINIINIIATNTAKNTNKLPSRTIVIIHFY